jgi:hypothetical protein
VETRSIFFLSIMIAIGALALLAFVVFLILRYRHAARAAAPASAPAGESQPSAPAPAATRLIGLLALALAFLVLYWRWLEPATGYAMMIYLVYPATLAALLVLLFDKATRTWSYKGAMAGTREWFFCDLLAFLLILAYANLWISGAGADYGALFWDLAGIALTLLAFWLVDRKYTRYRFVVAYAWVALLPIALLIWANAQEVPARLGVVLNTHQVIQVAAVERAPAVAETGAEDTRDLPEYEDVYAPAATGSEDGGIYADQPGDGGIYADQPGDGGIYADQPDDGGIYADQPDDGGIYADQPEAAPSTATAGVSDDGGIYADQPEAAPPPVTAESADGEASTPAPPPPAETAGTGPSVESTAVEPASSTSWWESIWPFFIWGGAFFLLEIIGLIAITETDKSLTMLLKDAVFLVGYGVLLLVAAA